MPITNAYLDTSQVINIGHLPNDGTGDSIRSAMDKINFTFANIQYFLLTSTNFTYANVYQTLYAFNANIPTLISSNVRITGNSAIQANTGALQVNGGTSLNGNVYIPTGSTIYVGGSPVATSAATFTGGTVPLDVILASTTNSTSYSTGALTLAGGAGIAGNVFTNKGITANGPIVGTSLTGTTLGGTLTTASQPNITALGTLGNLAVTNTLTVSGGITTSTLTAATSISTTGQITASGGISGTLLSGNQPNLTVGGQFRAVSINNTPIGNATPSTGAFTTVTANTINATDAIVTGNLYVAGNTVTVNSTSLSTKDLELIVASNAATAAAANGAGLMTPYSGFTFNSTNTTWSSNVGITPSANGTLTLGSLANQWGTVFGTTYYASGSILPTANVSVNIGSSSLWFNNIYGTAIHAQYADLAENYSADFNYEPGTVVVFGGEQEVTVTNLWADPAVAGVVSTNPAYLMNGDSPGVPVALRGRVPCKVLGPVKKGDLLVTAGANPGWATSAGKDQSRPLSVFAKALETDLSDGEKIIEVVIL